MQFSDPKYSNMFAVGDIADTGAQKAARPGSAQAAVVAKNIQAMIEGRSPGETFVKGPGAIHLTLGMVCGCSKSHLERSADQIYRNITLSSATPILLRVRQSPGLIQRMSWFRPVSLIC
jgi:hypothetical protein